MKRLSFVLAVLIVLSLVGCVEQNTPTTTPTEEVDVIWNKIQTAVNECNAKEYLHATLYLTDEDIHGIDWNTAPKVNEHWICGQTHYVEVYSQGEKEPHSLEHNGTFYLPGGENQWVRYGENTDGFDVTIDLPGGKDAIVDWTEVDGQLEVVLEDDIILCLDADGMLLWYSETTEGYSVEEDGQTISTNLRWILLYNNTPEQQIRQTVETVIANMEIMEPETEATTEPATGPQETVSAWENLTQPTVEPSADLTDVEYFQQLLAFSNGYEMNGYNAALNCTFEKPEDLDLGLFFWTHFVTGEDWEDLTDEEAALLNNSGLTSEFDLRKYSAEMMDQVLQEYFGLPLSAFQDPPMVYYEETGCYYTTGSSPLVSHMFQVTEVEYEEDGIVKVYYLFDPQYEFTGKYVLTLQEKQGKGETGYYILSHLRIE